MKVRKKKTERFTEDDTVLTDQNVTAFYLTGHELHKVI
jgi:hypothetical protein